MLKRNQIAVLIYTIATLQVLGYCGKMWYEGSRLANFLFLNTNLSEATCLAVSKGSIVLLLISVLWAFFQWSPWPFFALACVFLIEAVSRTLLGGEFAVAYTLPAEAIRFVWLFGVAYALLLQRRVDIERSLPIVPFIFRVGLALTFATHGWEALQQHPSFVDLIIVGSQRLTSWAWSEATARNLLWVIGAIDLVAAVLVISKPTRSLLIYMSLWGLITAVSRIIFSPEMGLYETLMRVSHTGVPLLVILLTPQLAPKRSELARPLRFFRKSRAS